MRHAASVLAVALAGLVACQDDATHVAGRSDAELIADLEARIADRDTWDQPAGWEDRAWISAGSPHGRWVDIRANDAAATALGDDPMPWGTILTKEHFDEAEGPSAGVLNALWKLRGLDAEADSYFWVQWQDGEVAVAGDAHDKCISCHSSGIDRIRSAVDQPGSPR